MQIPQSTFLVTGGGSGLGLACVELLAQRGANVVLADVNEQTGREAADRLGESVAAISTDVTSTGQVQAALQLARDRFATLHGVIHCAGILGAARLVGRQGPHDLDLFRKVIEVNLIGTFNVLRLAAAVMSTNEADAAGQRGVIVNTASVAAFEGQIGQVAYAASKGGVAGMTLPAARELAKFGIRVVAVAPGVFNTAMMQAAPQEVRESLQQQTVFPRRLGEPAEFAALAAHVIENTMINGSVLRLDGAMRMGPQ